MRNENGENNSCGEYTMIVTLNYGFDYSIHTKSL